MSDAPASALAGIDRWEPTVHALVDWDASLAHERAATAIAGPLSGWPIAVKDIIDVAGLPTRCGASFTPADSVSKNAAIVDLLEACGAFVISKSVTTTFAYLDPGPTRNPWDPEHTPGGSSSGSAAAVACGMARLALGTQTVGSINRPASYCGVVGFKPTYGLLPIGGVFPLAPSLDTVGYFTPSAVDAQHAFAALTGQTAMVSPTELRIAVIEDLLCDPSSPQMLGALLEVAQRLTTAGHQVRCVSLPDSARVAHEHHRRLVAAEAATSHEDLFDRYAKQYPLNLRQLIEFGRAVTAGELQEVDAHRQRTKRSVDALVREWDVVISPSAPGAAPHGIEATGDPRMNLIWTYIGLPTLTLPATLDDVGLPLGVQLTGAGMQDAAVLAAGVVVEDALAFDAVPPSRGSAA